MKRILLTGGGTAGHVTPNIAIIPYLRERGYELHYAGTADGIEKTLIAREGLIYHSIAAGKLRRYFDLKNFTDIFRIGLGFAQAIALMARVRPAALFSKGGFVSCPVVWAARLFGVPVIIHESDITPGLANRLSMPFARTVCHAFPETARYIPEKKRVHTGIPVRGAMLRGNAAVGRSFCGFDGKKPVMLVIGGSLGSEAINAALRASLDRFLERFDICHIAGKKGLDASLDGRAGYRQFEYINEELPHVFAMADIVLSRAGATTLFEIAALRKSALLVPLSRKASRGDQILNAESFKKQGLARVLFEEDMTPEKLFSECLALYSGRAEYSEAMKGAQGAALAAEKVAALIAEAAGDGPSAQKS